MIRKNYSAIYNDNNSLIIVVVTSVFMYMIFYFKSEWKYISPLHPVVLGSTSLLLYTGKYVNWNKCHINISIYVSVVNFFRLLRKSDIFIKAFSERIHSYICIRVHSAMFKFLFTDTIVMLNSLKKKTYRHLLKCTL